jgi:hypothetical protein
MIDTKAVNDLVNQFYDVINRSGCDRQTAIDALEYALGDLLTECFSDAEALDQYFAIMNERCRGMMQYRLTGAWPRR